MEQMFAVIASALLFSEHRLLKVMPVIDHIKGKAYAFGALLFLTSEIIRTAAMLPEVSKSWYSLHKGI
jgi:hypothetical protein